MKFSNKNKLSIKKLFNQIAKNYDRINDLMSFGMQKQIKISAVKNTLKKCSSPQNILDLCTGTGDIAILFKKFCPTANITAIDFSEEMLSIAKSKTNSINFFHGDITQISNISQIQNQKYDICFISFGLRNLPEIDEFLEEIKNYIAPGGILSILDLGKPIWYTKPYFFIHYNLIIPFIAKIFHHDIDPYKYFVNSSKTYPSQKEIILKLQQNGFVKAENKNFFFGIISQQTAANTKDS